MKKTAQSPQRGVSDRKALHRRVRQFYHRFAQTEWMGCHAMIDPRLTQGEKVSSDTYAQLMQRFKDTYGNVNLWLVRLSLHPNGAPKQGDTRPFAFVYVVWQDDAHGFHMFRKRWVKEQGQWFTRVVGLVPNKPVAD